MKDRQARTLESFVRVQSFLEKHPLPAPFDVGPARATLRDAIKRASAYAATQDGAPAMNRGERHRQQQQVTRIRDRHMRPLVTIARSQEDPETAAATRAAFRLPKVSISITAFLAACDAMIDTARKYREMFVAEGRLPDFLTRFEAARDELQETVDRRAKLRGDRTGAGAGVRVQLRRARLAVGILDAAVRATFEGNEAMLAEWRSAKRVRQRPGGPAKEK
jgi:hypothetical protein